MPCSPPGDLSNPGLLHCRRILYRLSYQRSPFNSYPLTNAAKAILQGNVLRESKRSSPSISSISAVCALSLFSGIQLYVTLQTAARQAPLSMGFSRQEYWSGLQCPPPGDLPNPGIEPKSLTVSCIGRRVLYHYITWELPYLSKMLLKFTFLKIMVKYILLTLEQHRFELHGSTYMQNFFQLIHITVLYDPQLAEFAGVEWWIQRANCKITQRFEDFQQSRGMAPLIPVLFKGQLCI